MKARTSILAVSIGMIILSVFMLVKDPAYGIANIGRVCLFMRNAAPVFMGAACIFIMFAATKLRILSIIGIALIAGSLGITYILAESTGYSMGTSGWVSGFLGIMVVIPAGLLLCCITGLVSLTDLLEKDPALKTPALISGAGILLLGIAFAVAADWRPDIHTIVTAIADEKNKYERFSLAGQLVEIDDDALPPLLIPLLNNENPRVREAAALALGGKSGNAEVVRPLLAALDRETDENAGEWMIRSLGRLGSVARPADRTEVVETLIRMLGQGGAPSKRAAAEALGVIGDERAVAPLIDALTDKDADFFAHNSLITITDKRFGYDPGEWRQWLAGSGE
jgi:hypothetical protein